MDEERKRQLLAWVNASGAAHAAWIRSCDLVIEQRFASMCSLPGCPSYGLSPSCPPHGMTPETFRSLAQMHAWVLVFAIKAEEEVLLGKGRLAIARAVHETAAALEREALAQGCSSAVGLAAGSCKELFCAEAPFCRVVEKGASCLFPEKARSSVSGVGLHVRSLCDCLGWKLQWSEKQQGREVTTLLMLGMVLVASPEEMEEGYDGTLPLNL